MIGYLLHCLALTTRLAVLTFAIVGALVADAEAGSTAYALIVTNNHAGALSRPDLQYADDDGARYYELFASLAPADHLTLLTEFDPDTAGLFPALVPIRRSPACRGWRSRPSRAAPRSRSAASSRILRVAVDIIPISRRNYLSRQQGRGRL